MTTSMEIIYILYEDRGQSVGDNVHMLGNKSEAVYLSRTHFDPEFFHLLGGALTPLLAGYSVLIFSDNYVFGFLVLLASITNLLFDPLIFYDQHMAKLIFFITGVAESSLGPVVFSLLAKWCTKKGQVFQVTTVLSGIYIGDLIGHLIGLHLATSSFWYISALIHTTFGFLVCIYWAFVITSSTRGTVSVTNMLTPYHEEASESIDDLCREGNASNSRHFGKIPWRSILSSKPLIVLIYCRFVFYLMYEGAPMFIVELLNNEGEPVLLILLSRILILATALLSGVVAVSLRLQGIGATTTRVRRIVICSGLAFESLLIIWISSSISSATAITAVVSAVGLSGWTLPSLQVNFLELAPHNIGIVSGLGFMASYIAGLIAKVFSAYVAQRTVSDDVVHMLPQNSVFLSLSALLILAAIFYGFLGQAEHQHWDNDWHTEVPKSKICYKPLIRPDSTGVIPIAVQIKITPPLTRTRPIEVS